MIAVELKRLSGLKNLNSLPTTHGSSFFKTKKLPKERPLNYENIDLVWMKNGKIKKIQGGKLKKWFFKVFLSISTLLTPKLVHKIEKYIGGVLITFALWKTY